MISGAFTILATLAFAGVTYWAYTARNRARFDEAALLPLMEDQPAGTLPPCCSKSTGGAGKS